MSTNEIKAIQGRVCLLWFYFGETNYSKCAYILSPSFHSIVSTHFYVNTISKFQGDDCPYSHEVMPPMKLELCKFYLMECCAKGDKCLYMHSEFPCKFYHTGLPCYAGDNCRFAHGKPLSEGETCADLFLFSLLHFLPLGAPRSEADPIQAHRDGAQGNPGRLPATHPRGRPHHDQRRAEVAQRAVRRRGGRGRQTGQSSGYGRRSQKQYSVVV